MTNNPMHAEALPVPEALPAYTLAEQARDAQQVGEGSAHTMLDGATIVQMPLGDRWAWVGAVLKQLQEQAQRDSVFITALGHKVSAALECAQRGLRTAEDARGRLTHTDMVLAEVRKDLAHWREIHADRLDALEDTTVNLKAGIVAHDNALKQHGQQLVGLINAHNQVVSHLQQGDGEQRIVVLRGVS